ncbi:DUF664 domain-containing protein [Nocardioides sp. JQ2195]|uniref:mycothiol transferase n=1 Tax=Nocardioides sp. JQ2195 TaxID=2592334 RepID=UPI00143ED11D|nr:DUF664 domain-containing protein [Nocardioides sp. JQ2195]QIX27415.1 DUF664 domain-containing protein [Nocardioides sp. JQ2195]
MPAQAPPVVDERDGLRAYVIQQQDAYRAVIHGLTDEEAGLTPTRSSLSVGALVKHATHNQLVWGATVLAAPALAVDDRPLEEQHAERERMITWLEDDTVDAVLSAFDEASARVLDAIATIDLDTPVPVPPAPWNPPDVESWSVRWVWLHLIEELARHSGHADIIRESIDGATMFELIAGREGWPETPWIKPWRRAEAQEA